MKVTLMMAMTLDGKIGKNPGHFPDWTGSEDKKLFAALSRKAGVVIMGSRTFDTIGRPLPDRLNVVMTRDKTRRSRWDNLRFTPAAPGQLLADLDAEGYTHAILAGGAIVNTLFAKAGCIDDIVITVCPLIFGQGIGLFADGTALALDLQTVERLGRHRVCLTYGVCRDPHGTSDLPTEIDP
ncbi:MAG: dihydrofolate reductase [Desulfobacterales bacterium]|nr:dihydrofolate reductase [Desulfobacterales bacterium]